MTRLLLVVAVALVAMLAAAGVGAGTPIQTAAGDAKMFM